MLRLLSPADRLAMLVVASFLAITLASDPHPSTTAALLVALGAALVFVAAWGARSRAGEVAHAFFSPYASVALLFEMSSRVVAAVHAPRYDAVLAAADARWFPRLASAWHDALGRPPWLTDAAGIAYVSFYFFPLAVGLALFVRRPRREFERFAFVTEAAFFVPYVGYVAMPASGPRDAMHFGGATVAYATHAFVSTVELNMFDAFPSGHTAVAVVVAALAARAFPRWSALFAFVAGSIVFSTVYLSYHYVIDVVVGALVALAMPLFVALLRRLCGVHTFAAAPSIQPTPEHVHSV